MDPKMTNPIPDDLLGNILSASGVGIAYIVDRKVVWVNESLQRMFGVTQPEQYLGRDSCEFYGSKEEYMRLGKLIAQLPVGGLMETVAEFRRKDNGSRFLGQIKMNVLDPKNPQKGMIANIVDITEQLKMEASLKTSEENFRRLSENLPGMVFRLFVKDDFRMEFFNDMLEFMTGYRNEELNRGEVCHIDALIVPEDRTRVIEHVKRAFEHDSVYEVEYRIQHKSGDIRHFIERGRPVRGNDGRPSHIDGVILDQSARKRAEEGMNRQLEELMSLFDGIDEAIYVADPVTYEVIYANGATKAAFDREIVGRKCYQALQGLTQPCDFCTNAVIFDEKPGEAHIWEFRNHINQRWYRCIDKAIEWPDGRKVRYELAVDIHELKEAESALRDSEYRYRILAENIADGVAIYQNGTLRFVNPSFAAITEYAPEELIGMSPLDLFHPDFHEQFRELVRDYERGVPGGFHQSTCIRKDGSEIWTESHHSLIQWQDQPALLCTVRDITESKLRELAMEEEKAALQKENMNLRASIRDRYRFGNIIGKSSGMQEVYELIIKAANSGANIVVQGESGTGKELIARTIHDMSDRRDKAFVPVNCGAVPESLFESEFFGYRKGAFTGALMDKHGFFDLAEGGTLFLDEVGELNLNMQAKLLRAIEGGGYVPVGGREVKKTDVRIVAATNRDLSAMVQKQQFRLDFFYRLNIIPIQVPPLRERREDIPLLVEHFLKRKANGSTPQAISAKVLEILQHHSWPGNVRELQNLLQRYLSLGRLDFIGATESRTQDACEGSAEPWPQEKMGLRETIEAFERDFLLKMLKQNCWHRGRTAEMLEIPERTLYRKLKQYQLN